jgi:UDP-GlcNAc:undecaprenyl-phosphate GlcNAc-1-phosphate transferase
MSQEIFYVIYFVLSICFVYFLIIPIKRIALKLNILDHPNIPRKSQSTPVPYLGGVAIAVVIWLLVSSLIFINLFDSTQIEFSLYALVSASVIGLIGLIDDIKGLGAISRLFFQFVVGIFVAFFIVSFNFEISFLQIYQINILLTILWIMVISNSVNFIDNIDGGSAGIVIFSSIPIAFIAFRENQIDLFFLVLITSGSLLGFLLWNKFPAKIYLGDSGALFIGVLISIFTIKISPSAFQPNIAVFIPIVILTVPILDFLVAITSRLGRGVPVFVGGTDHLSHRLMRIGISRKMTPVILWSLSLFYSVFTILFYLLREYDSLTFIALYLASFITLYIFFMKISSKDSI